MCVTWLIHACDTEFALWGWVMLQPIARLVHTCDRTSSYVWHDLFICVTCLIYMCDMTHLYVWHVSFIRVTWLIHMSDISFICVTWLIHTCDMTHSCVWHVSSVSVIWLIHICDMTRSYVTWLNRIYMWFDLFSVMWDNSSLLSEFTCNSRWLTLVGSLKLQVSFAKEPYNRDYILQKRPVIWRSLLSVATPYIVRSSLSHILWSIF